MTQTLATNINNVFHYREKIFTLLTCSIAVLALLYGYFLHAAITSVVAREDLVKESRLLATLVSELETKYFIIKDTINIELAYEIGFKDPEVKSFISGKSVTAMANHHEL